MASFVEAGAQVEITLVLTLITTNCLNTEQQNLVVGLNIYSLYSKKSYLGGIGGSLSSENGVTCSCCMPLLTWKTKFIRQEVFGFKI